MRILHLQRAYPAYIDSFYAKHPTLARASFAEQYESIAGDFFPGATDSKMAALASRGYETATHVMNVEPLLRAWAQENQGRYHDLGTLLDITRAQVLSFRPDVLFANPFDVPIGYLREIRSECPSIRLIISRYSSPQKELARFRDADVVISGDASQVDEARAIGVRAYLVHHAFDQKALDHLPARVPRPSVFFAGSVVRYEGFHFYREEVLRALQDAGIDLELHLMLPEKSLSGQAKVVIKRLLWDIAHGLSKAGMNEATLARVPGIGRTLSWRGRPPHPVHQRLRRSSKGPLFGLEMLRAMRNANVTLNVHGDVSRDYASNIRLWQATGVGSCLLTDAKKNMGELFELGSEIVTYDSADDCTEKARWLLDNPQEADRIAVSGQKRVLRDHTYEQRAAQLTSIIDESIS